MRSFNRQTRLARNGGENMSFSIEMGRTKPRRTEGMDRLKDRITGVWLRLSERKEGQGYTEYVILLALIAIGAYLAVQHLGTNVSTAMQSVASSV
jgi:Flp pilus assembly pilin Flp